MGSYESETDQLLYQGRLLFIEATRHTMPQHSKTFSASSRTHSTVEEMDLSNPIKTLQLTMSTSESGGLAEAYYLLPPSK